MTTDTEPTEKVELLNIYQRINEIRKKVEYIKKDAKVQGYQAITHDAVTGAIRDYLVDYGVVVVPNEMSSHMVETGTQTGNGTPWMRYEAKYTIEFVNIDEPEQTVPINVTAHAMDTGDKAPGKALSYATKMAMLKLFSIETGEDDEERAEQVAPDDGLTPQMLYKKFVNHMAAVMDNIETVMAVKGHLMTGDFESAVEAWSEIEDYKVMQALFLAPTKGGCFTVKEKEQMGSKEFKELMRASGASVHQP